MRFQKKFLKTLPRIKRHADSSWWRFVAVDSTTAGDWFAPWFWEPSVLILGRPNEVSAHISLSKSATLFLNSIKEEGSQP